MFLAGSEQIWFYIFDVIILGFVCKEKEKDSKQCNILRHNFLQKKRFEEELDVIYK